MKIRNLVFFVKSAEKSCCPICQYNLKVAGSRKRVRITSSSEKEILIIRRLYCEPCNKIHHELPDVLVSYKRYDSESIQSIISEELLSSVSADESTVCRWKQWFRDMCTYYFQSLLALYQQLRLETNGVQSRTHRTALEGIIQLAVSYTHLRAHET